MQFSKNYRLFGILLALGTFIALPLAWAATFTTFGTSSSYTSTHITLSGGNLIATQAITSATDQSAMGLDAKSAGLFYAEGTFSRTCSSGDPDAGLGISKAAFTPTNNNTGVAGQAILYPSGHVYVNGSQVAATGQTWSGLGTFTLGMAVDFTHANMWWTIDGTHWNSTSSGTNSPATNTGGISISSITGVAQQPIASLTCASGTPDAVTFNAGATGFVYSSAFTALQVAGYTGWTTNVTPAASFGTLIGVGQ